MAAANTPIKPIRRKAPWVLLAAAIAIVISILIYWQVTRMLADADQAQVESTARSVRSAILQYEQSQGPFVLSSYGNAGIEESGQERVTADLLATINLNQIDANVVDESLIDPWGNPYDFRWNDVAGEKRILMLSNGPDGAAGTSDDIVEVVWSSMAKKAK